ncbi:MAG TPA: hypothetical protein VKX96_14090 [Chloroflexota bacterium]|nr:hypothetical protein [Chloroflexota bacterium]
MIYLNTPTHFPLSVGLSYFPNQASEETKPLQHLLMVTSVMMITACIVLFVFTQRYFVRGMIISGIKT